MDWTKDISIHQIPSEHMQLIASTCGIDDAVSLMVHLPGLEIYVPAAGKKYLDHKFIKENFNGSNAGSLAVKLGIDRDKVIQLAKSEVATEIMTNFYMRTIKDLCGESVAIRLMQNFPRQKFYVPRNGFDIVRRKYIEDNFNGTNVPDLALLCSVTERHVRDVISEMYASTAQTDLFSNCSF